MKAVTICVTWPFLCSSASEQSPFRSLVNTVIKLSGNSLDEMINYQLLEVSAALSLTSVFGIRCLQSPRQGTDHMASEGYDAPSLEPYQWQTHVC